MKDFHHFENPGNFSLEKGRLRIIDYGDPKTQKVVIEFGKIIMEGFDPGYKWEEKKRE